MQSSRTSLIVVLLALMVLPIGRVAQARDQVPATGSAIAPVFSIEHSSMRPGEAVVLVACVTNGNPDGKRQVEPGDTLSFEGAGVTLVDCEMAPVDDRGAAFAPGSWSCSIDGSTLRLTFMGPRRTWPRGELVCARVHALAPMASATMFPAVDARNFGAWAPAEPAVLFLTVDAEIGSVGPQGPAGRQGPEGAVGPVGPVGPSGVGVVAMATSTSAARAWECDPAVPVPGLDLTMSLGGGGRIVVHVDALGHPCAPLEEEDKPRGILLLELDGAIVVRHRVTTPDHGLGGGSSEAESPTAFSWLSDPLTAGAHRLRVLFEYKDPGPVCFRRTSCIGGVPGSDLEAHLVALEMRAP